MNDKEFLKQKEELRIFKDFAGNHLQHEAVNLSAARNCAPPYPDVECSLHGLRYFFELGEITDRGLAAGISRSARTGEMSGGAFSQDLPLLYILESKARKKYKTEDCGLDLLLHYSKQYPYKPLVLNVFKSHNFKLSALFSDPSFPFRRIWIYNDWNKELVIKILCDSTGSLLV